MITGKKEELDSIAKGYVCKDDGGHLTVAWQGIVQACPEGQDFHGITITKELKASGGFYMLRCEHDHYPEEVTRQPSLTQMYKQGEELPSPLKENVEKSIKKQAARLPQAPGAMMFTGIPATDLETGELIPLEKLQALVVYAHRYGLDPARGHVALMHGLPYIGLDGYLYHAKQLNIPYSLTGRPLREDELKALGYEPGDLGWYSKIERHDTHQVFEGYGFVKKSELTEMSKKRPDRLRYPVVAEKPGVMVIKRGDWQVSRRAFPIGEPPEVKDEPV